MVYGKLYVGLWSSLWKVYGKLMVSFMLFKSSFHVISLYGVSIYIETNGAPNCSLSWGLVLNWRFNHGKTIGQPIRKPWI